MIELFFAPTFRHWLQKSVFARARWYLSKGHSWIPCFFFPGAGKMFFVSWRLEWLGLKWAHLPSFWLMSLTACCVMQLVRGSGCKCFEFGIIPHAQQCIWTCLFFVLRSLTISTQSKTVNSWFCLRCRGHDDCLVNGNGPALSMASRSASATKTSGRNGTNEKSKSS